MNQPDWNEIYERRCARVGNMLKIDAPKPIIEAETRMLYEACHGGRWPAIRSLIKHELASLWAYYGFMKWEWIRTRVFRRPQDEVLAAWERVNAEGDAVDQMVREL